MMVVEYGNDIIIIDAGLMFPDDEMFGVDLVIADTSYLSDKKQRIRGILITHGHEDHVGGLPYVLPMLDFPPIYTARLTQGLINVKLKEHKLQDKVTINVVNPGDQVELGDTVILSATPVPGNEKMVNRTINNLFRQGADVLYQGISNVHVSGHAAQEELKLMLNLLRPKFFMPVHGEYRQLVLHEKLACTIGIPMDHIVVAEDGDIVEVTPDSIKVASHVASGNVYVDGLGVGDVGHIVLRDRQVLAQD